MKTSTHQAFIPFDRDCGFRNLTGDSGPSPKSVTIKRNPRSASSGIAGHDRPEIAVTMVRNTQQISTGRYSSASEYVRELIRADEKRKAEEQLEAKLLDGLNSAEHELTPADWSALRKEALERIEARKKSR